MQLQELNKKHRLMDPWIAVDCIKQKIVSWTLTINFFFNGSIGMEDTECMDKFVKFNDTNFLFIKKIKNLESTSNSWIYFRERERERERN